MLDFLILIVIMEHLVLMISVFLTKIIGEEPKWVTKKRETVMV